MDSNGTRYHLLLGARDWLPLLPPLSPPSGLEWKNARACVQLAEELFRFPASKGDRRLLLEDRRGAARDRFGNWYWISQDRREVRVRFQDARSASHFWTDGDESVACPESVESDFAPCRSAVPSSPRRLAGLTVSADHRLVVGILGDSGPPSALWVFDLHAGGPPTELRWPPDVVVDPVEILPAPCGGVWILDRNSGAFRLWFLDRHFRVIGRLWTGAESPATIQPDADFIACPPGDENSGMRATSCQKANPTDAVTTDLVGAALPVSGDPVAAEILPDGSLLLLERISSGTEIRRLHPRDGVEEVTRLEELIRRALPSNDEDFVLAGHDLAFLPEGKLVDDRFVGRLFVVGKEGNQAFAFEVKGDEHSIALELIEAFYPLRSFGGMALVTAGDEVWFNQAEAWRAISAQPRPRFAETGIFQTGCFDGRDPDCVWHRLVMDACIPAGASIRIQSRAANLEALLEEVEWTEEPLPYRREGGSELPWHSPAGARPGSAGVGSWELIFQRAHGRFVQLRISLHGNGRNTPRLYALRCYYPRFSYLREYLPACYRDDPVSADFLERFLANPEGLFTALEGRIEAAQVLFDPRTLPVEYLDWLGQWLGVAFEKQWDENKRRLFLANAIRIFQRRGTISGLILSLKLALEPCVEPSWFDALTDEAATGCDRLADVNYGVRFVEGFLQRRPHIQISTTTSGGRAKATSAAEIHAAYRGFLRRRYSPDAVTPPSVEALRAAWRNATVTFETVQFSPLEPGVEGEATDWNAFRATELGFAYAPVSAADITPFQHYLQGKYRQIRRLREAWQWAEAEVATFGEVRLPDHDSFPDSGVRFLDWIEFASEVLPIRAHAHRFTVLLPVPPEEPADATLRRAEVVRRVLSIEQPAHVRSEVKFYWAAFRAGEARLGFETRVDRGSRWFAVLLGRSFVAEGFLGMGHPWDTGERMVVGRDVVSRQRRLVRPKETSP